jgi:hypothetical protein
MNNRLFEYTLALSIAQQRAELRLARRACDSPAEIERIELVLRWLNRYNRNKAAAVPLVYPLESGLPQTGRCAAANCGRHPRSR